MSRISPKLTDFRRIVIKVGSSLLVDSAAGRVREVWLDTLAEDIAQLHKETRDILAATALGEDADRLLAGAKEVEETLKAR